MKKSLFLVALLGYFFLFFGSIIMAKDTIVDLAQPQFKTAAKILRHSFVESADSSKVNSLLTPYVSKFSRKFIVLSVKDGDFGGFWVTIIIDPKEMTFWHVWLYPIGDNNFQIRDIIPISVMRKDQAQFKSLFKKKYQVYWN